METRGQPRSWKTDINITDGRTTKRRNSPVADLKSSHSESLAGGRVHLSRSNSSSPVAKSHVGRLKTKQSVSPVGDRVRLVRSHSDSPATVGVAAGGASGKREKLVKSISDSAASITASASRDGDSGTSHTSRRFTQSPATVELDTGSTNGVKKTNPASNTEELTSSQSRIRIKRVWATNELENGSISAGNSNIAESFTDSEQTSKTTPGNHGDNRMEKRVSAGIGSQELMSLFRDENTAIVPESPTRCWDSRRRSRRSRGQHRLAENSATPASRSLAELTSRPMSDHSLAQSQKSGLGCVTPGSPGNGNADLPASMSPVVRVKKLCQDTVDGLNASRVLNLDAPSSQESPEMAQAALDMDCNQVDVNPESHENHDNLNVGIKICSPSKASKSRASSSTQFSLSSLIAKVSNRVKDAEDGSEEEEEEEDDDDDDDSSDDSMGTSDNDDTVATEMECESSETSQTGSSTAEHSTDSIRLEKAADTSSGTKLLDDQQHSESSSLRFSLSNLIGKVANRVQNTADKPSHRKDHIDKSVDHDKPKFAKRLGDLQEVDYVPETSGAESPEEDVNDEDNPMRYVLCYKKALEAAAQDDSDSSLCINLDTSAEADALETEGDTLVEPGDGTLEAEDESMEVDCSTLEPEGNTPETTGNILEAEGNNLKIEGLNLESKVDPPETKDNTVISNNLELDGNTTEPEGDVMETKGDVIEIEDDEESAAGDDVAQGEAADSVELAPEDKVRQLIMSKRRLSNSKSWKALHDDKPPLDDDFSIFKTFERVEEPNRAKSAFESDALDLCLEEMKDLRNKTETFEWGDNEYDVDEIDGDVFKSFDCKSYLDAFVNVVEVEERRLRAVSSPERRKFVGGLMSLRQKQFQYGIAGNVTRYFRKRGGVKVGMKKVSNYLQKSEESGVLEAPNGEEGPGGSQHTSPQTSPQTTPPTSPVKSPSKTSDIKQIKGWRTKFSQDDPELVGNGEVEESDRDAEAVDASSVSHNDTAESPDHVELTDNYPLRILLSQNVRNLGLDLKTQRGGIRSRWRANQPVTRVRPPIKKNNVASFVDEDDNQPSQGWIYGR